jgi:hypothetical protein
MSNEDIKTLLVLPSSLSSALTLSKAFGASAVSSFAILLSPPFATCSPPVSSSLPGSASSTPLAACPASSIFVLVSAGSHVRRTSNRCLGYYLPSPLVSILLSGSASVMSMPSSSCSALSSVVGIVSSRVFCSFEGRPRLALVLLGGLESSALRFVPPVLLSDCGLELRRAEERVPAIVA